MRKKGVIMMDKRGTEIMRKIKTTIHYKDENSDNESYIKVLNNLIFTLTTDYPIYEILKH